MKKAIISLLVIIALACVAIVSCPDKQAHKDAIMAVVNEKIEDDLGAPNEENADVYGILSGVASIGSHVGGWLLDSNLSVKNHFVYSEGYLNYGGEQHKVSVGVFGHVFTFSKEDLDKALEELF